jgi:DNA-binding transcriptional MocR family regulator
MKSNRIPTKNSARPQRKRALWAGILIASAVVALAPLAGRGLLQDKPQQDKPQSAESQPAESQSPQSQSPQSQSAQAPSQSNPAPSATQPDSMSAPQKQGAEPGLDAHKTKIAGDTARLLQLATDLKAEVDKTTKDTLSVNVIRKADQIEKLAHDARVNIKPAG